MPAPRARLTHALEFAAAHRLELRGGTPEQSRALYGPCANDHGHSYRLEVTVEGPVDPETGMVVNLVDLGRLLREVVFERVDHRHLNRDVPFLAGAVPTAEHLALAFWRELEAPVGALAGCRLVGLRLRESRDTWASVGAPDA